MASGGVTFSFEERADTSRIMNHEKIIQERIKMSLMSTGKSYTGMQLDGEIYTNPERVMISTHKGPMLAKFDVPNPIVEVRSEIKKIRGDGKNSIAGKRQVELAWFKEASVIYVDPMSGRGDQSVVGWSDVGVDYNKSGSIFTTLIEWLPQMGLGEIDPVTMSGLLDALSGKENYTMLFVKAVMIFRTLCVGFSVDGVKFQGAEEMPECLVGDKRVKVGNIGTHECTFDLDYFTDREAMVAMLSSMQYPSIACQYEGMDCVYSHISMPACDALFVSSVERKLSKAIPTPERWWKALVSLASKLGAMDDLITAFRITRGLGSWAHGLKKFGLSEFVMTMGITATRGCRSVLTDSVLSKMDTVAEPTNLACSLGELICDWAAGQEMINMFFHISDEFGLANADINRNVSGIFNCSVGDSILREAGFYDFGPGNTFYDEMCSRVGHKIAYLGDDSLKAAIQHTVAAMLHATGENKSDSRAHLRSIKNLAFTNYYGPLWTQNATVASRLEGKVNSSTWGATARSKKEVFYLRMWMDIHGLSDQILIYGGFNAIQRMGLEAIGHTSIVKLEGAHGTYSEIYRELNWRSEYTPRLGSEAREKDRLDFVKTYLGMEAEDPQEEEEVTEPSPIVLKKKDNSVAFRGTVETEKVGVHFTSAQKDKLGAKDDTAKESETVEEVAIDLDDVDVTAEIPQKQKDAKGKKKREEPPKKVGPRTHNIDSVTGKVRESFGSSGVNGFARMISQSGSKYKVKNIDGDGLCVARALAESMRDRGISVQDNDLVQYIRTETAEKTWFEVDKAVLLMQRLGLGVALYDTRDQTLCGIGTEGKNPEEIIGITFDGRHCDSLVTGLDYDRLIMDGEVIRERATDEVREMVGAIFGND